MRLTTCATVLCLVPATLCAQGPAAQGATSFALPAGTPLPVRLLDHAPMKVGAPLRTELLYAVYVDDELVLPAHTVVTGTVAALEPDRKRRIDARLHGDFTPYSKPVVRFDSILSPAGQVFPISTTQARDGAPVFRSVRSPTPRGGFVGLFAAQAARSVKDAFASLTGPRKGDRFVQFLYSQLPYHPQRIAAQTAWTTDTEAEIDIPELPAPALAETPPPSLLDRKLDALTARTFKPEAANQPPRWVLQAYLDEDVSSDTSTRDQMIHATVAEPVLAPDGSVEVAQGSVLTGSVTLARPSRSFTRAGVLRFNFTQMTPPGGAVQTVNTTLVGADSSAPGGLELDREGNPKPKAQDKVITPLVLLFLASRPLDGDGNRQNHTFGKDAVASNSLGLIGFIIGTAARQPNIAAGIGYYGAALSLYPRFFAHGKPIAFPKDTRIVLETTPTRGNLLRTVKP